MGIRTKGVTNPKRKTIFPESNLAKKYCHGEGLEIGAAAHNPFGLPGALNVSPADNKIWKDYEVVMCGMYAEIDIEAEGDDISLPDSSQDYIISSHVLEHMTDPIKALIEWSRLVKPSGVIFIIVPQHSATPEDARRKVTRMDEFLTAHQEGYTVDTIPEAITKAARGRRGHYWVFSLGSLLELVHVTNQYANLNLEVVEKLEKDDKVGNGYCVVLRQGAKPEPVLEEIVLDTESLTPPPESFVDEEFRVSALAEVLKEVEVPAIFFEIEEFPVEETPVVEEEETPAPKRRSRRKVVEEQPEE